MPGEGEVNLGTISLGVDGDRFAVMCRVNGGSIRSHTTSVVRSYVHRLWEEYKPKILEEANKYGITFDECYHRRRLGLPMGVALLKYPLSTPLQEPIPEHGKEFINQAIAESGCSFDEAYARYKAANPSD